MNEIKKIAVIGSGVMGASIAAHIANSGTSVILFDIVPKDAQDRNELAKNGIKKLLELKPAPLVDKKTANLIIPANLEDDLEKLKEVDWVIEAIIEKLEIKQGLYEKITPFLKADAVLSSNTSTLPISKLTQKFDKGLKERFLISHFFNPPRYMRLLELVSSSNTKKQYLEKIAKFCDENLGKGVVPCFDTAGFIANRIGCFFLQTAINYAINDGITVEEADACLSKPIGVPKTGAFGLMDLIGIDLLPLIAKSFANNLDKNDSFLKIYKEHPIITQMITDGYTGRKGKGGFYTLNEKKEKQAKNLKTGAYLLAKKIEIDFKLKELVQSQDKLGAYTWKVLRDTIIYTASIATQIAGSIYDIDEAMRLGYNWKWGIFEILDKIGLDYFKTRCKAENVSVPDYFEGLESFYKNKEFYNIAKKSYAKIPFNPEAFYLAEVKDGKKPVIKNGSASLWDLGQGVACLEFTSKMNALDPDSIDLINKSVEEVKKNFKALVFYNDAENFCVGANIGVLLFSANTASWKLIDEIIKKGQDAYMGLKYAPFPVVSAPSGMALGGGCELLLHSHYVVSHIELYTGLVEVGVGLIPAWGGTKELILRNIQARLKNQNTIAKLGRMFSFIPPVRLLNIMPALQDAFLNISTAKVSGSAIDAKKMLILGENSQIVMNRKRLLPTAINKAIELSKNFTPLSSDVKVNLPGKTAKVAFEMGIRQFEKQGKATAYDAEIARNLAFAVSGGNTGILKQITENDLLALEREVFAKLIKDERTLDRIEHMLEKGSALRN
jgi:3-hydroxyacyl-CoA dehydrogenase